MCSVYLIFYACLSLWFADVEINPGQLCPAICRIICGNVQCSQGTFVTWPWLRLSQVCFCALICWSQIIRITCRSCWFLALVALICCARQYASGRRDGCIHVCDKLEGGCEMLFLGVCWVRQNSVFSLYCNPDKDDWILTGWRCGGLFPVCGWFEWT